MATDTTLGTRLRAARIAKHLSQERLAVDLGVSWATVHRWERDKNTPSLNRIRLIADVLDVPVAELLDGDGVAA